MAGSSGGKIGAVYQPCSEDVVGARLQRGAARGMWVQACHCEWECRKRYAAVLQEPCAGFGDQGVKASPRE